MPFNTLDIKSNSKFFRVETGNPQDVRLLQDTPMERIVHGFGNDETECTPDNCMECSKGSDQKQRFEVNIYNHTVKKVMIWEFGGGIAKQLKSIAKTATEDGQDILNIDLKVEAEGSGKSKKYKVTPRMSARPIPEGLKLLPLKGELPF